MYLNGGLPVTVRGYHLPFGVTIYRLGLPFTVRRYHLPPGETPSKWERLVKFGNAIWGGVGWGLGGQRPTLGRKSQELINNS